MLYSPRCRVEPYLIKATSAAPLARRQRRALPPKARGARRATPQSGQTTTAHMSRRLAEYRAVLLAAAGLDAACNAAGPVSSAELADARSQAGRLRL
jgi:hypothetical protein